MVVNVASSGNILQYLFESHCVMAKFPGSVIKWKHSVQLESLLHVLKRYRVEADTAVASCWLQCLVGSRF